MIEVYDWSPGRDRSKMSANNSTDASSVEPELSTMVYEIITTDPTLQPEIESPELRFVFVPLTVIVIVLLLTGMIFSFIRKKRVDRLRHHLMPMYNFAPGEDEGDWEAELLEDGLDHHKAYIECVKTIFYKTAPGATAIVSSEKITQEMERLLELSKVTIKKRQTNATLNASWLKRMAVSRAERALWNL